MRHIPEQTQLLTLTGCVQAAPARVGFILENVRTGASDHQPTDSSSRQSVITEGSWVYLSSASDTDLGRYTGKEVTIAGSIRDDGRSSSVGTVGAVGDDTPSGDKSQAATEQHHAAKVRKEAGPIARHTIATGDAPEIQVKSVSPTGKSCADRQEKR